MAKHLRNENTENRNDAVRKDDDATEHRPARSKRAVVDEGRQRELYGGFHFIAAFFGWLVTNGVAVLLLAIAAAAGSGYLATSNTDTESLAQDAASIGIGSAITILIVMMIAYYAGGYVAGRMARFNGVKQGVGVWVLGLVVVILLAIAGGIAGSNLDALRQVSLPSLPVDGSSITTGGLLTLLVTAVLTLLAAIGGGKQGEGYHRKIDRAGVHD